MGFGVRGLGFRAYVLSFMGLKFRNESLRGGDSGLRDLVIFGCLGVRVEGSRFPQTKASVHPRRARKKGSWTLHHPTLGSRDFVSLNSWAGVSSGPCIGSNEETNQRFRQ